MHDHGAVAAGRASAAAAVAAGAGAAAATTTYGILCQLNDVYIYICIYTGGS